MKRKIVRVFEETALLKEAGLLSKIKSALSTSAPPPEPKKLSPNQAAAETGSAPFQVGDTGTSVVLDRIFSVPTDSVRCILFLNQSDFKTSYFLVGGEEAFANGDRVAKVLPQNVVRNTNMLDGIFVNVAGEFDLKDVTISWSKFGPLAVLLNVKRNVFQKFDTATTPEAKLAAFQECILHKNYVAVLNTTAIIDANVGALTDEEDQIERFNMKTFIKAYPSRTVIDTAIEEWVAKESKENDYEGNSAKKIDSAVRGAVAYVAKAIKSGLPKTLPARAVFDKGLLKVFDNALSGSEELMFDAKAAFLNSPSMVKADIYDLLSIIGKKPISSGDESFAANPTATQAQGKKSTDSNFSSKLEVGGKSPLELAKEFAGHHSPSDATEFINALRKISTFGNI